MALDPFAPLPPELETGPLAVPVGTPNQFGGVHVGVPVDVTGAQARIDADAEAARKAAAAGAQVEWARTHNANTGALLPNPPVVPPVVKIDEPLVINAGPDPVPTLQAPPVNAQAMGPTMAPPAPARAGGGGAGVPKPSDLEKDVVSAGKLGEQGIEKTQAAKAEGADAVSRAYDDLRVQQQMDAQEQKDKAEANRKLAEDLDKQDAANLKKARDYVIPDFWKGAEAARIGSIVTMAMGSISQAVIGGPNGAAQIINKNVDDYFHRQKEKVDNLYKYAEQQGKLDDRTRLRYAQELLDLKDQHSAVQQSVLSHISSVEKQVGGNIARAETDTLKANLQANIAKSRAETREDRAKLGLIAAQTSAAYANAFESRQKGKAAGQENSDKADEAATRTYAAPLVKKSDELTRRVNSLKDATAGLKDPNSSSGEVIAAIEAGISANTGAGVRGVSMGQLHSIIPNLVSADGKISDAVSQQWNGKAGQEFRKVGVRFVQRALDQRSHEMREEHESAKRYLGSTPYGKRNPDFADRTAERLFPQTGATTPANDPNAEARAWAKANPNDPRSAKILARVGQ